MAENWGSLQPTARKELKPSPVTSEKWNPGKLTGLSLEADPPSVEPSDDSAILADTLIAALSETFKQSQPAKLHSNSWSPETMK